MILRPSTCPVSTHQHENSKQKEKTIPWMQSCEAEHTQADVQATLQLKCSHCSTVKVFPHLLQKPPLGLMNYNEIIIAIGCQR